MQMTVAQYAKKMKVHRTTVYLWVKNKSLPDGTKAFVLATHLFIDDGKDQ